MPKFSTSLGISNLQRDEDIFGCHGQRENTSSDWTLSWWKPYIKYARRRSDAWRALCRSPWDIQKPFSIFVLDVLVTGTFVTLAFEEYLLESWVTFPKPNSTQVCTALSIGSPIGDVWFFLWLRTKYYTALYATILEPFFAFLGGVSCKRSFLPKPQAVKVKVEGGMLLLLGSYFFAFLFNQARISIGWTRDYIALLFL